MPIPGIHYAVKGLVLLAVTMLILIQQDADGQMLINGWHGLALACAVTAIMAIYNCFMAVLATDDEAQQYFDDIDYEA